jgi:hypothetical protein
VSDDKQKVGRLAFRVEGDWWVCYYAAPDTMDGAFELGRIAMRLVEDRARKEAFMAIFRDALSTFMQDMFGQRPDDFRIEAAPEHERAGRA